MVSTSFDELESGRKDDLTGSGHCPTSSASPDPSRCSQICDTKVYVGNWDRTRILGDKTFVAR